MKSQHQVGKGQQKKKSGNPEGNAYMTNINEIHFVLIEKSVTCSAEVKE